MKILSAVSALFFLFLAIFTPSSHADETYQITQTVNQDVRSSWTMSLSQIADWQTMNQNGVQPDQSQIFHFITGIQITGASPQGGTEARLYTSMNTPVGTGVNLRSQMNTVTLLYEGQISGSDAGNFYISVNGRARIQSVTISIHRIEIPVTYPDFEGDGSISVTGYQPYSVSMNSPLDLTAVMTNQLERGVRITGISFLITGQPESHHGESPQGVWVSINGTGYRVSPGIIDQFARTVSIPMNTRIERRLDEFTIEAMDSAVYTVSNVILYYDAGGSYHPVEPQILYVSGTLLTNMGSMSFSFSGNSTIAIADQCIAWAADHRITIAHQVQITYGNTISFNPTRIEEVCRNRVAAYASQ